MWPNTWLSNTWKFKVLQELKLFLGLKGYSLFLTNDLQRKILVKLMSLNRFQVFHFSAPLEMLVLIATYWDPWTEKLPKITFAPGGKKSAPPEEGELTGDSCTQRLTASLDQLSASFGIYSSPSISCHACLGAPVKPLPVGLYLHRTDLRDKIQLTKQTNLRSSGSGQDACDQIPWGTYGKQLKGIVQCWRCKPSLHFSC